MSIEIKLRPQQPPLTRSAQPVSGAEYIIQDTNRTAFSREVAYYHFINHIPPVQDALLLNEVTITPTKAPHLYYGSAKYRVNPIPSEDAPLRWTGTTRAATGRIYRSLETVQTWTRPVPDSNPVQYREARDLNGALGVDDDNNVRGADALVPNEEWTLSAYMPEDLFNARYRQTLRQMARSVNLNRWHEFKPFEVLFKGSDFDDSGEATKVDEDGNTVRLVRIDYFFKAGFNENNLIIGDLGAKDDQGQPVPIFKRAHDRLEIDWEEELDPDTNTLTRRPAGARLERIYEARKFSLLGLGGTVNEDF